MKKNISINISGIIFHIEEDGYDSLRKYLDSINKYFSSFEDSSEIMADIESRIAEIFLSKLNEGKQVITAEDVHTLITTMGSVSDFKAAEEPAFNGTTPSPDTNNTASNTQSESTFSANTGKTFTPARHLMRDQQRKILGGVCAGLGNYFNVDPLWIRLLFAALAFAYGVTIVIYLVMWIVVPGSYTLDEPMVDKKMFRDPERKVLGGVAGGVASYFGIDVVIIRLLFVIFTIIGGLGLLLYIVLWIALPEARTLTDRMQMQGEPVTLSNIESTIKKNLNVESGKEESAATKILLFPFRLIALVLKGLAKVIGPLVEALRVIIGIFVVLLGITLAFSILLTGGVTLGIFSGTAFSLPWMIEGDLNMPVDAITKAFPGWIAVAGFIACLVPSLMILLLGVSIISKRIVFSAAAGWTLFVLFFVSVVMLSIGIPQIVYAFKEDGTYKIENTYHVTGKKAALQLHEVGMDNYHETSLSLKGYDGKDFKLVQEFQAQGSTRQKAIENAQMVDYSVNVQDSVFTFDSNILFKKDAVFRAQRLEMTLYIPYDFPFTMTEDVSRFITQYVDGDYLDGETWRMTPKGLDCLTCPVAEGDPETEEETSNEYDLTDFREVEVSGLFDVRITRGDEYSVELTGPEDEKEKYKIEREGNTLVIDYDDERGIHWGKDLLDIDKMKINIIMPQLEKLKAKGAGKISFKDFTTNDLDIDVVGAVDVKGEADAEAVTLHLSGASQVSLEGKGHTMEATVQGASTLRAYSFEVEDAVIEVNGASSAKVNVTRHLEMEEGIASDIDYRGHPDVVKRDH
ncbi:MAG TPA: PspC domain-containing protein [Ohtaekwangia sp.]|uniref:PspC domain-containing protein n=1 Tax=Ohtaekwangia sp. TaxID=2066019 RepID=UPI002F944C30